MSAWHDFLVSVPFDKRVVSQEEELQERERSNDERVRELHELSRTHSAMCDEHARIQAVNGELRSKLEDSKQQLKGNEQMIRWLNSQVTFPFLVVTRVAPSPPLRGFWRPLSVCTQRARGSERRTDEHACVAGERSAAGGVAATGVSDALRVQAIYGLHSQRQPRKGGSIWRRPRAWHNRISAAPSRGQRWRSNTGGTAAAQHHTAVCALGAAQVRRHGCSIAGGGDHAVLAARPLFLTANTRLAMRAVTTGSLCCLYARLSVRRTNTACLWLHWRGVAAP